MAGRMQRILDADVKSIFNPNIWLLVVLIPHTLLGALVPMYQTQNGSPEFAAGAYGLVTSIMLLSIYLFSSGRSLARMTALIGSSVFLYSILVNVVAEGEGFQIEAELIPPFNYNLSLNVELAPTLLLWGMLGLSGFAHWNVSEETDEEKDPLEDILELVDQPDGEEQPSDEIDSKEIETMIENS